MSSADSLRAGLQAGIRFAKCYSPIPRIPCEFPLSFLTDVNFWNRKGKSISLSNARLDISKEIGHSLTTIIFKKPKSVYRKKNPRTAQTVRRDFLKAPIRPTW